MGYSNFHRAEERALARMRSVEQGLRSEGRWTRGPADLLSVLGRRHRETYHSKAIAWLLDPLAPHGLGDRFLQAFLGLIGEGRGVKLDLVRVATEVFRRVDTGTCRADVVVWTEAFTLIVENKVYAAEQVYAKGKEHQCDRLHTAFGEEPNPLFVFLTLGGNRPTTATDEAADAFKLAGYPKLLEKLEELLQEDVHDAATADPRIRLGRATAHNYCQSLRRLLQQPYHATANFHATRPVKAIENERVRFYLEHRQAIDRWAAIRNDVPGYVRELFLSLGEDLEKLAGELEAMYRPYDQEGKYPKLFLVRKKWLGGKDGAAQEGAKLPLVAIGVEWREGEVGLHSESLYGGLWVNVDAEQSQHLYSRLLDKLESERVRSDFEKTLYWPARQFLTLDTDVNFWDDFGPFRQKLTQHVKQWWDLFAGIVDDVLDSDPFLTST